jgi:hypothetical protein
MFMPLTLLEAMTSERWPHGWTGWNGQVRRGVPMALPDARSSFHLESPSRCECIKNCWVNFLRRKLTQQLRLPPA